MEKETILKLKEDLIKDLENVTNSHDLEEISIKYLSKNQLYLKQCNHLEHCQERKKLNMEN